MAAAGAINLTNPSQMADGKTDEDPPGGVNFDDYIFTADFNISTTFTLTGNFESLIGAETSYSSTPVAPNGLPGSFSILNDGTFTYTVTLAEAGAFGLSSGSIEITGFNDLGGQETDTITFNFILCFAAGTRIATPTGERNVDSLAIGDSILAADGRTVPVKWIGRTTIHPMFNPADRLDPVRIARGALGQGVPSRDLIVTPDHGLLIDGMVINAGALVGADGIDWYPWKAIGQTLTYFHIETEDHDVILANGIPAETFIDYAGRRMFENFAEYLGLYGAGRTIPEMDRHRISDQRLVPGHVRARLGIPDEPAPDFANMFLRDAG